MKRSIHGSFTNLFFAFILIITGCNLLLLLQSSKALAEPPDTPNLRTWETNGNVHTIVSNGPFTFIGGEFTYVGPNTGFGAPISVATGNPIPPYSRTNNYIFAVA